jgi:hypothetical protein
MRGGSGESGGHDGLKEGACQSPDMSHNIRSRLSVKPVKKCNEQALRAPVRCK